MTAGMSVTDIAASISLDYASFMQGMKSVEQRFVDFSKSTASPFYPGSAPDQGGAHVGLMKAQEGVIMQQLLNEQIAIRNREEMLMASLRREQQAAIQNAKQTAQAEAEIVERSAAMQSAIRERYAKEDAALMLPLAKANAEKIRKFNEDADAYLRRAEEERKQKLINDYNKSPAFVPGYGNYAAAVSNMQAVADAEVEIANRSTALREAILARYATEADNKRKRAKELDDKAYEENKRRSQEAASADIQIQKNTADVERSIAAKNLALREQDSREAESIINRLKTAQELHNERVSTYARLLKTVNVETGRTYLTTKQYNEAVKESERVMRASAAGAGAYTGMLAQASFAAEDFVQGIAVGDLRSALLGASNNLTMVARGAFQAAEGVTILGMGIKTLTAYIIGIPAAIVGVVAAFSYLNRAERDVRDLSTALRDLERGFELLQDKMNFRQQAGRERQRIDDIESLTQAQKEYQNVLRQQKDAEEQLTAARARQSRMGSETLINTLGGQAAYAEMQELIQKLQASGHEASVQLGNDMSAAMADAMSAAQKGEVEKMIDAMRRLNELSNSLIMNNAKPGSLFYRLNLLLNDISAQDSLEAIFNTGWMQQTEDQDALRKIRESMLETTREIAKAENELKQAGANKKQLEEQILKLKEDGRRLLGEEFEEKRRMAEQDRQQFAGQMKAEADMLEEKRKRAMFDMTATERQKELLRIQEQMREFMGPSAVLPFIPPGIIGADQIAQLMQQNAQNAGMQFLQGQAAQLEKEIKALQQSASPEVIGGMQQNAAAAQADAFKQIFAAANKQANPQLTRQIQLLQDIRAAIAQGGTIQVVGQ